MSIGLGFFCSTSGNKISTNHKLRLANLTEDNIYEVFHRNLEDFIKLLEISRIMGLSIFRLGSNFIPFASHPRFNKDWLDYIGYTLKERSSHVKSYGIRITMHPGQFVVLNSNNPTVIERSLKEIEYHFWVLDTLELGPESIVVVHIGGVYEDKQKAIQNLYRVLEENRWLTRRIALENDERYYTVEEVLDIAESFNIPMVYDHYHHKLNPSGFKVDRLISTWRGLPLEIHVSSENEKSTKFGEHGDYIKAEDFTEAIGLFPEDVKLDVIVEAKKKEYAITRLLKDLRDNYPWILSRLRTMPALDEHVLEKLIENYSSKTETER